jgi:hypothetical protein
MKLSILIQHRITLIFFALLSIGLMMAVSISGCDSCGDKKNNGKDSGEVILTDSATLLIQGENVMFSVPSPVQTTMLIKQTGAKYNENVLNNPKNVSKYNSNFQKSLNLGAYGADLGYAIMYDQSQDALLYLSSIKKLADDLGMLGIFDLNAVKKLEQNIEFKDSLLRMNADLYRDCNGYLKTNHQEDIGLLILAGGWLEGVYFSSEVLKDSPIQELRNRIGEQKNTLKNLIKSLNQYQNKMPELPAFIEQLNDLARIFNDIEIQYTFKPTTHDAATKTSTVNSVSKVVITEEQIQSITKKINQIRNQIVA